MDHVLSQSGKAKDIGGEIMSVIRERYATDSLQAVICNGTNVNTEEANGVIQQFESPNGLFAYYTLMSFIFALSFTVLMVEHAGPNHLKVRSVVVTVM